MGNPVSRSLIFLLTYMHALWEEAIEEEKFRQFKTQDIDKRKEHMVYIFDHMFFYGKPIKII